MDEAVVKEATILIVDDEKDILAVTAAMLARENFVTLSAANGREALDKVLESGPDLVLLDYMMPGMNGLDVLKEIKKVRPETEVVIVTGRGSESTAADSIKLGAADYVSKPFERQALVSTIKRVLAEHKERLEAEREEIARISRTVGKQRLGDILVSKSYASYQDIENAL